MGRHRKHVGTRLNGAVSDGASLCASAGGGICTDVQRGREGWKGREGLEGARGLGRAGAQEDESGEAREKRAVVAAPFSRHLEGLNTPASTGS